MDPNEYELTSEIKEDKVLGYEYFRDKEHPLSSSDGKVYYHRHVASEKIGRWLEEGEEVHHKDENRSNNDPENLNVVTRSEHVKTHISQVALVLMECEECGESFKVRDHKLDRRKYCSRDCLEKSREKIDWPNTDWLERMVDKYSYLHLSRKLGVSDNAIRKRIKNHS